MSVIYPVLLCGGSGTRLWPLSRQSFPKQFSRVIGNETLFQAAAKNLSGPDFNDPIVVTSNPFRFITSDQLAQVSIAPAAILIEPDGRNTAPAVLVAALWLADRDPDAIMIVAPSDHVMPDVHAFRAVVLAAVPTAREGRIVTFGIQPTHPETGYGYLELAQDGDDEPSMPRRLSRFIEKPDPARASAMLEAGHFLWNAGIFMFTPRTIIQAFERHAPDMIPPVNEALKKSESDLGFTRLAAQPWGALPNISIDYAIMEKEPSLSVMPFSGPWSDLGSWEAVWQESGPDRSGNVVSQHATALDCKNTLLRSESETVELVGIGLSDIVAIATQDAVVVVRKSDTQRVKDAVAKLKARGARQATEFARDHRPWGWFESLAIGSRFQVKKIVVKPGASLSLQSHHHRSEHWIVVEGTALVTVGNKEQLVAENQSVYVPLGEKHRLRNLGKLPMVLIEVQIGGYLGEDDIVRYEDMYARN
jgi:mannose-1-phosphate guanylyltransferase/mannose-6-phosphate isomerase